jgi:DNA-binding XRE family transcriptional regulator
MSGDGSSSPTQYGVTDETILVELGRRIARARSAARLTQTDLAKAAGVTKATIGRLEAGAGSQLVNLVRCLRALNLADDLARLVPERSLRTQRAVRAR